MGAGAEPEGADEKGRWTGSDMTTKKWHCMCRGNDDYDKYAPPHPESKAAAAAANLEPVMPFTFGSRYAGSPPRLRG